MAKVIVRRNESPEKAIKRFKRKVERAGIMRDIKKNRYYRKPSVRKKEKKKAEKRGVENLNVDGKEDRLMLRYMKGTLLCLFFFKEIVNNIEGL